MANITDLTELSAAPASGDVLLITDISDTTQAASGTSKYVTTANFRAIGSELAASYVHADNYADDIQAAVDAAAAAGVSIVKLNPGTTYNLTSPLDLPAEITLDGGGDTITSAGITAVQNRARINADAAMDYMIGLADFAGVRNCYLHGQTNATVGIQAINGSGIRIRNHIEGNFIRSVATGIKLGGATYCTIRRNGMVQISGIGLDALASYSGTYYGGNVVLTEMNEWKGTTHHVRFEGIWTSISDDFEGGTTQCIESAGTNSSRFTFVDPYAEAANCFYRCSTAATVRVVGGFIDGAGIGGEVAFAFDVAPGSVHLSGCRVTQFETVFTGTMPVDAFVIDKSVQFASYTTFGVGAMTLYSSSYAKGVNVNIPGTLVYNGHEVVWTDANVASFDCMTGSVHRMALTTPATINPSTGGTAIIRGHVFTIIFDGNTTLNDGATSNKYTLAAGADKTPPDESAIQFVTNDHGRASEIGDYTARL